MSPRSKSIKIVLVLTALMLVSSVFAGTEIVVDGVGPDRESAIADAQRNAISTVVGQMVDSSTLVSNYTLVSDQILTSSSGYLTTYQVENEGPDSYGYRVRIRAMVETESIRNDVDAIAVLSAKRDNPRFIVVPDPSPMSESFNPNDDAVKQAAMGIREYLSERQLQVIEAPAYNIKTGMTSPSALKDLSRWGAGIGAEYVVYFSVKGMPSGGGRTFFKATAVADVAIVHTGSYQVVAQVEGKAIGSDREESLAYRKAGRLSGKHAAEKGIDLVLANWARGGTTAGNTINLILSNVKGEDAQTFDEQLRRSGAVKNSQLLSLKNGEAVYKITLEGGSYNLASAVDDVIRDKGWNWALIESDASSLTYQVPFKVKTVEKSEKQLKSTLESVE